MKMAAIGGGEVQPQRGSDLASGGVAVNLARPWTYGGRAARAGHRLESEGVLVAIQSPHPFKGWEIYRLDAGLEVFAGYTAPASQALLDNTLAALLDARSEAA